MSAVLFVSGLTILNVVFPHPLWSNALWTLLPCVCALVAYRYHLFKALLVQTAGGFLYQLLAWRLGNLADAAFALAVMIVLLA